MKYFQPSYTTCTPKTRCKALDTRLGTYQHTLQHAFGLHIATHGTYKEDATDVMYMHEEQNRTNAIKHVTLICKLLDIEAEHDYAENKGIIREWFGSSVYVDDKEFVSLHGVWYERTWKKVTLKAPTSEHAVLFWRDYSAENKDAVGMGIVLNGKRIESLKYGRGMENMTNKFVKEQGRFTKGKKIEDAHDANKRLLRYAVMDDQLTRLRTEILNKAAKEILKHSRFVLFTGPMTVNDQSYFRRSGITDLIEFLKLAVVMGRKQTGPIEIIDYDVRLLRSVYESSRQGHTLVATKIAQTLGPYAKARKTVNKG